MNEVADCSQCHMSERVVSSHSFLKLIPTYEKWHNQDLKTMQKKSDDSQGCSLVHQAFSDRHICDMIRFIASILQKKLRLEFLPGPHFCRKSPLRREGIRALKCHKPTDIDICEGDKTEAWREVTCAQHTVRQWQDEGHY
ncbi:Dna Topoisomerase 2-Binding Protein 1 [Manis pentadactyla]|nr:Dna Topoisomerase 2-Binding Protein 1 [Manis pentadactyla]